MVNRVLRQAQSCCDRRRSLISILALLLCSLVALGCDDTCDRACELFLPCSPNAQAVLRNLNPTQDVECRWADEDQAMERCVTGCVEGYDILSDKDAETYRDSCLPCLEEQVGEECNLFAALECGEACKLDGDRPEIDHGSGRIDCD